MKKKLIEKIEEDEEEEEKIHNFYFVNFSININA